jgi:hypothetical protein
MIGLSLGSAKAIRNPDDPLVTNVCNKLECLSLSSLGVRQELTRVKHWAIYESKPQWLRANPVKLFTDVIYKCL